MRTARRSRAKNQVAMRCRQGFSRNMARQPNSVSGVSKAGKPIGNRYKRPCGPGGQMDGKKPSSCVKTEPCRST